MMVDTDNTNIPETKEVGGNIAATLNYTDLYLL
jgi:hypothetical protein